MVDEQDMLDAQEPDPIDGLGDALDEAMTDIMVLKARIEQGSVALARIETALGDGKDLASLREEFQRLRQEWDNLAGQGLCAVYNFQGRKTVVGHYDGGATVTNTGKAGPINIGKFKGQNPDGSYLEFSGGLSAVLPSSSTGTYVVYVKIPRDGTGAIVPVGTTAQITALGTAPSTIASATSTQVIAVGQLQVSNGVIENVDQEHYGAVGLNTGTSI